MKPQDVVVLLKIIALNRDQWQQIPLAQSLKLSQSEISQSLARSRYAGLLDAAGKKVMRQTLMDFLHYGLAVEFPVLPGAVVRGLPTAHSAVPLKDEIYSSDIYVWPFSKGSAIGQGIIPLYPTVAQAALEDAEFYALLALADAVRVGKAREKNMAVRELKNRIC